MVSTHRKNVFYLNYWANFRRVATNFRQIWLSFSFQIEYVYTSPKKGPSNCHPSSLIGTCFAALDRIFVVEVPFEVFILHFMLFVHMSFQWIVISIGFDSIPS